MVQKYTAPVRVFKYPFELVMAAYERRFPTCHLIPVFVGSDKIYENESEDGAIHVIERRCRISIDAPYVLRKLTGVDHVLFIQKNTLDRRKRVLRIEAWNESFSSSINIHELCYYRVNPENENWTTFEQQASLEVKSFWGFEHVVEKLAVKHYSQNIKKGEEIIEYHVKELRQEGITYIAPFEAGVTHRNHVESDEPSDHLPSESHNGTTALGLCRPRVNEQASIVSQRGQNGVLVTNPEDNSPPSGAARDKTRVDFRSNSTEDRGQVVKHKKMNSVETVPPSGLTNSLSLS